MYQPGSPDTAGSHPALAAATDAVGDALRRVFIELPGWLTDASTHFYWLYLLSFVAMGIWAVHRHYPDGRGKALAFIFPRAIYLHPSAVLDYKLLLLNRLLSPSALLTRLLLGSGLTSAVAVGTQAALLASLGTRQDALEWSLLSSTAVVIGVTLVRDFGTYVTHALSHLNPFLWEFHKVHHSAEVLTPLTLYRKHPVYNVFGNVVQLVLVAPVQGLVAFLFLGEPAPLTLFGANLVFSLFHLLGANLRHSHLWLTFGPVLGRILISPAQHQIHHSKAERHWNRNYGEVFALWDWLFGTLYLPGATREVLEFGVAGAVRPEHTTLWEIYTVPFRNCLRLLRGPPPTALPPVEGRAAIE